MKWKDFKPVIRNTMWEKTDIECPECGDYVFKNNQIVLTTYPPKHRYECFNCGWSGVK